MNSLVSFKNGFFLEVGANDGISYSNTIRLEKSLNWKGILIEPGFHQYLKCSKNRPNSIVINAALVSKEFRKKNKQVLIATDSGLMSKIYRKSIFGMNIFKYFFKNWSHVNCYSLDYLLNHLEINKIDFFSLDVEGNELEVLKGINFDVVDIKYICVEVWDKDKDKILKFFENNNFHLIKDLSEFNKKDFPNWSGNHNDFLFKNTYSSN